VVIFFHKKLIGIEKIGKFDITFYNILNEKQKAFADQYIVDRNGTQAALRAGYAFSSARVVAHNLLNDSEVKEYIQAKLKELSDNVLIDISFVAHRFKQISDRCMQAEAVMIYDGEAWVESGEYKFDSAGANKATEALGKIVGAFEKDNEQSKATIQITIDNNDAKLGE